jgi:hypothetical protein
VPRNYLLIFFQSFCPEFLATALPIVSLTLLTGTLGSAELLARAFNLEEIPAVAVSADHRIALIENLSPEDGIEQRANSKPDTGVQFQSIWKQWRSKSIYQLTDYDSCVYLRWEQPVESTMTYSFDPPDRILAKSP